MDITEVLLFYERFVKLKEYRNTAFLPSKRKSKNNLFLIFKIYPSFFPISQASFLLNPLHLTTDLSQTCT